MKKYSTVEEKQRVYYNTIASTYDKHHSNSYALTYRHTLFDNFLKGINLSHMKILDAMCGGGENAGYFLKYSNVRIVGIDISEAQCDFFKKRFPQAEIVCGSILKTTFTDNSFDFIFTESLHHLHPNLNEGLQEMIRVLKPGGYLMIWEPNRGSFFDWARRIWYRLDSKYFEENEQSVDFDEIVASNKKQLSLVKYQYGGSFAHLLVVNSMLFRIPEKLVRLYAPLLIWLENIFNKVQINFTSCWVLAVFQKRS